MNTICDDDSDECDENVVYMPISMNQLKTTDVKSGPIPYRNNSIVSKSNAIETSLGRWCFDKKSKRKSYTSLNGKVLYGKDATFQSHLDKDSQRNHIRLSLRRELEYMMCNWTIPIVKSYNVNTANSNMSNSSTSIDNQAITYDLSQLESWGVPLKVVKRYDNKGVLKLFQWQIDCLSINNGKVLLNGENLVYSAPTSGGKTIVAELLMLRRLGLLQKSLFNGTHTQASIYNTATVNSVAMANENGNTDHRAGTGTIFFIVPYVALVEEKSEYFREMWDDMNICVKAFHGGDEGSSQTAAGSGVCDITPDIDIAVCTIERANIL